MYRGRQLLFRISPASATWKPWFEAVKYWTIRLIRGKYTSTIQKRWAWSKAATEIRAPLIDSHDVLCKLKGRVQVFGQNSFAVNLTKQQAPFSQPPAASCFHNQFLTKVNLFQLMRTFHHSLSQGSPHLGKPSKISFFRQVHRTIRMLLRLAHHIFWTNKLMMLYMKTGCGIHPSCWMNKMLHNYVGSQRQRGVTEAERNDQHSHASRINSDCGGEKTNGWISAPGKT